MKKYLKNPIILAIIVGTVMYLLMNYFYNTSEKPKSKKSKSKNGRSSSKKEEGSGFFTDKRETVILVSVITALGTWLLAKTYIPSQNQNAHVINLTDNNITAPPESQNIISGILGRDLGSVGNQYQYQDQDQDGIIITPVNNQLQQDQFQSQQQNRTQLPSQIQNVTEQIKQNVSMANTTQSGGGVTNGEMQNNMPQYNLHNYQAQKNTNMSNNANMSNNQVHNRTGISGTGKSYNLIGSGLDMPRDSIPRVLIDY